MNPLIYLFVLSLVSHVIPCFVDRLMRFGTTVYRFYLLRSPEVQNVYFTFSVIGMTQVRLVFFVVIINCRTALFKTKVTIGRFPMSLNLIYCFITSINICYEIFVLLFLI